MKDSFKKLLFEAIKMYPPGSDIAKRMGCRCDIFSNNYGKGHSVNPDAYGDTLSNTLEYNNSDNDFDRVMFVINFNCPLHSEGENYSINSN